MIIIALLYALMLTVPHAERRTDTQLLLMQHSGLRGALCGWPLHC